jgi:uncharacterized protein YbaR (Trm112 family)
VDPALLEILCCPLTGEPLHFGSSEEKGLFPGDQERLLVREDGLVAYPVKDGIPRLVPNAAISRR